MYQLTNLDTLEPLGSAVSALPAELAKHEPTTEEAANLRWAGYEGQGYWRCDIATPALAHNEVLTAEVLDYAPNLQGQRWTGTWGRRTLSDAEIAATRAIQTQAVDAERDRRIALGFEYAGKRIQSRPSDYLNFGGASTGAVAAIVAQSPPGDLRWQDPDVNFAWIAEDNTLLPLDARGMLDLGRAALAHRSRFIFIANNLKRLIREGAPVTDVHEDEWWALPVSTLEE